jgi:hypothetical protein
VLNNSRREALLRLAFFSVETHPLGRVECGPACPSMHVATLSVFVAESRAWQKESLRQWRQQVQIPTICARIVVLSSYRKFAIRTHGHTDISLTSGSRCI